MIFQHFYLPSPKQLRLLKKAEEFETYITNNQQFIPNYGDRNGERIATGFVESRVNQVISKRMVKKQPMRWTPKGAITDSDGRLHIGGKIYDLKGVHKANWLCCKKLASGESSYQCIFY